MLTDLVRWEPIADLDSLRADIDRLFARSGAVRSPLGGRWRPTSDVVEGEDEIVITAELPGVKDEDIRITVQDGVLRIAGERRLEEDVSTDRYRRIERSYGDFERRFTLPPGVHEDDISAGVAYGVLKITIPKPRAAEPKVIAINPEG